MESDSVLDYSPPRSPSGLRRVTGSTQPKKKANRPESTIDGKWFLNALRRWWRIATPLGFVCAALAAAGMYLVFEPQYRATARIDVEPHVEGPLGDENISRHFMSVQREKILSPNVLEKVLRNPEVAESSVVRGLEAQGDVLQGLSSLLSVDSRYGSSYIRVSFTDGNPENAALIVNAVVDEYLALDKKQKNQRDVPTIETLNNAIKNAEKSVTKAQENVGDLARKMGIPDPFSNKTDVLVQMQPQRDANDQLAANKVEQLLLEASIKTAEAEIVEKAAAIKDLKVTDESLQLLVKNHPAVTELKGAIASIEAELEGIERRSPKGKEAPFYRSTERRLKRANEELASLTDQLQPRLREELENDLQQRQNARINELRTALEAKKSKLAELAVRYQMLEKLHADARPDDMPEPKSEDAVAFYFAKNELEREQALLNRLEDRLLFLDTQKLTQPFLREAYHKAKPPTLPLEIVPYKKMAVSGLAGFCIPFVLLGLWDLRQRRITDLDQLQKQSEITVLGEVANLPSSYSGNTLSNRVKMGVRMFEESIDSLRTGLLLQRSTRDVRVLAITSAISGEGKTSVSAQLAVSVARSTGQPTLLIDGDIRSPDLHEIFERDLEPGLCEVLAGDVTLDEAICETDYPNLDILTAGHLTMNPHRLLGNFGLDESLKLLRQDYSFIIIDTSPILGASESLMLTKASDASLLCVMRDVSSLNQVSTAWDRLEAAEAHPAGAVLNNVPTSRYVSSNGAYPYPY